VVSRSLPVIVLWLCTSLAHAQTVDQVVDSHRGGCTTAGVEGLSEQLVRSHLCAFPGAVSEFTPHPNIELTSGRVHPLGTAETVRAIRAAADRQSLRVTSAFRTLVQQYLLYHEGGCGLAARPGRSNHQTGRAVDLSNYGAARSAMTGQGCTQTYPSSDPVHYDCPGPDMRDASVLVFQRLWNANNPGDRIDEDGAYGPQTEARLGRSPARGFGSDLCVATGRYGASFVMQTFPVASAAPIPLYPGEEVIGTLELENSGTEDWTGDTRLAPTPRDGASPLAASDWLSPTRVQAVDGTVPPGETFPFTFHLRGPETPGRHCQTFGLVQEGVTWFSDPGQGGPPDDQLQVCVEVSGEPPPPPPPADGGVTPPARDAAAARVDAGSTGPTGPGRDPGVEGCACRASGSGGAPWLWLGALGLAAWIRQRRRRAMTTCDSQ